MPGYPAMHADAEGKENKKRHRQQSEQPSVIGSSAYRIVQPVGEQLEQRDTKSNDGADPRDEARALAQTIESGVARTNGENAPITFTAEFWTFNIHGRRASCA